MKINFEKIDEVEQVKQEDYRFISEGGQYSVVMARGECRNAGYDIDLVEAEVEDSQLELTVRFKDPDPGMMVAMVITYPTKKYALKMDSEPKKVIFRTENGDILNTIIT